VNYALYAVYTMLIIFEPY